jgi:nicotinamidase-related amidase
VNTIDPTRCALVLVDYQARLMPAIHDAAAVVATALKLADVARELGLPIVGTEQNPAGLGANVESIRGRCQATLAKMSFDACADGLAAWLRERDVADVVIAGCEAHVCLMQSALGLLRAGYRIWVVADACGSRFPADKALAMARMQGAGATLVSAEMVAFEWLQSCENARFKPVLSRLKAP